MGLYEIVTKLSKKELMSVIDILSDIKRKNGIESLVFLMSSVDINVLFVLRNISLDEISIFLHPLTRDLILQSRHSEIYTNLMTISPKSPLNKNYFPADFDIERSISPVNHV
jgi:hypothetical protein